MAKGNKTKRPRNDAKPPSSGGLVIVNPALLRAVDKPSAPPAKKHKAGKDSTGKPKHEKTKPSGPPPQIHKSDKKSGTYVCDACKISVTSGARLMHEQGKKHKRAVLDAGGAAAANFPTPSTAPTDPSPPQSVQSVPIQQQHHLHVRDEDVVGAVYYLLEVKNLCRAVVVVPTKATGQLTPQCVAGTLKQLGFSVFAIHSKTNPTIRQNYLDKFGSSSHEGVVVTTEHFASLVASATCTHAATVVQIHASPSRGGYALLAPGTAASSSIAVDISKPMLQKATARANLASSIFDLQQAQPQDHDAQWIRKLANASGLGDEPEAKPKALTPAQQKLQALSDKLFVLIATPLAATSPVNPAKMKQKLAAVGLVAQNAATGMSIHNTRLSAQTQWLDAADGGAFGGAWEGSVRHGATKDVTSLVVRASVTSTDEWAPNPEPSDVQQWGGLYGKPCGHNEVVLQTLRPFFPQEVLNARVCSRMKPAPGNDGYDGCLEFLQWQCRTHKRPMTVWDAEHWLHVTTDGKVSRVSKKVMLTKPLSLIRWLVSNLRVQTVRWSGSVAPAKLLEALGVALVCGTSETTQKLPLHVRQCILQYAVTGNPDTWKRLDLTEKRSPLNG
ncbi:hypothetical protein DYB36_001904 [Aphanomyces astaci]|uniref:U1-type domain-containing protein n=1 Tax=Aphanomyces astaci TaxID=112090 RepID=A0A397AGB1_APHAT|nr:hypothetical protein DYB36_001904 [Aphanomyces astaci]